MEDSESEQLNDHYKVIVEVFHCDRVEIPDVTKPQSPEGAVKTPLIKNVLGENLYTSLKQLFQSGDGFRSEETAGVSEKLYKREEIHCEVLNGYKFVISDISELILYGVLFMLFVILLIYSILLVKRKFTARLVQKINVEEHIKNIPAPSSSTGSDSKTIDPITVKTADTIKQASVETTIIKVKLSYQLRSQTANVRKQNFDLPTFLTNVSETLFSKLDQLLLKDPLVDQTRGHATIATPRLARRPLGNRQRIGSTPTLSAVASTSEENQSSFIERKQAWDTLKTFAKELNWKQPDYFQFEDSKFDRKNQRLVHYYQRVCPIKSDHWKVTAFLTNFTLFLLQAEKDHLMCQNGYRFLEFLAGGSGKLGTMVGRPNEFDVLMVMQSPVNLSSVIVDDTSSPLPPGHIIIGAELPDGTSISTRETTCYANFGKNKQLCLSAQEFQRSAGDLIEMAILSLYTKTRSLMDRLPFVIRRCPSPGVVVSIDTKALVGLGLPEVKINITPVLPLNMKGWYQTESLYAMPVPEDYQYKQQTPAVSAVSEDYLWQVNCEVLNAMFLKSLESRMKHAGVESCHELCLMILKTLFTGKDKNSLLDKGVVQSYILTNAVNFLLLESNAVQWSIENLSDRFSDLIHFLRAAYTNGRLPHFFIHNPHLSSGMPNVADNPVLARKKQLNLLADMSRERLDKCLDYMESCIGDAGLTDCVKEEYSDDMWELEFFLF